MAKRSEYKFPKVQLRYPNGVIQIVNWVSQEEYEFFKGLKIDTENEMSNPNSNTPKNGYFNLRHKIDRAKAVMKAYDIFITSDSPLGRAVLNSKSGGKTRLILPEHQGGEMSITIKILDE